MILSVILVNLVKKSLKPRDLYYMTTTDDWVLKSQNIQTHEEGSYICQIYRLLSVSPLIKCFLMPPVYIRSDQLYMYDMHETVSTISHN